MKSNFIITCFLTTLLVSGIVFAQDKPETNKSIPGWFRLDSDGLGLQLWAGATHSLGPVDIATDIYVTSDTFAEFDIGPAFVIDHLTLTPMIGAGFSWEQKRMVNIIPQLLTTFDMDPVYFESLIQTFLNSPLAKGSNNDFYTRNFLLLKLSQVIAVGPQIEMIVALNNDRNTILSQPIGGHINLKYGPTDRLELFMGYEIKKSARQVEIGVDDTGEPLTRNRGLVGRFSYIHTW